MDIHNHPCFNPETRHKTGRIHLPVAAKCNVQCNFCNRKYDCVNESRPGVSTNVLNPEQAETYLGTILKQIPNIAVVGIAGPGDPFANAPETMETLERIHASYPDKLLCLSSNGLYLADYIPRLAELNVSHVTITVNAVDPKIGAEIYEWVYYDKKTYTGQEGARILLDRQTEAIKLLKQHNITVKINTVVIPRVNEFHVPEISEYVTKLGADIQNCIPLIPVEGTAFAELDEPSAAAMRTVRANASIYIKQMSHCARCRADAAGLLGQTNSEQTNYALQNVRNRPTFIDKPYIAIATSDGVTINRHLGEAEKVSIYRQHNGIIELLEERSIDKQSKNRWEDLSSTIADCAALLVTGIGRIPYEYISKKGIFIEALECPVKDAVEALYTGNDLPKESLKIAGKCGYGSTCSGKPSSNNICH